MTEEEIIDCIIEIDEILEELESALQLKQYKKALVKLKEAREAIDDLREDDCSEDTAQVEMNVMNELK